jgi:hypothetical protein
MFEYVAGFEVFVTDPMSRDSASGIILGMPIVSFRCVLLSLLDWGCSPGAVLPFGDSGSLENEPCLARNGLIHHLVADRTYALTVHDEDLPRFGYLLFAWG